MAEKKLSEELRHCLEGNGCADCTCYETKSVLTCRGLLQKAHEVVKRYDEMDECRNVLKLPINIETPIYSIEYCCGENKDNKMGMCFRGFCSDCEKKSHYILEATAKSSCQISEIGKTVFLEKEAAEKALKEMEDRKNREIDKVFK